MTRPIKTLLFSTLYPSSARPSHGLFVETRLRELLASGVVETKVIAPVPWFPFRHARFGQWAVLAQTPAYETRSGVEVLHPRFALPPKIGMNVAPYVLAAGALPAIKQLIAGGFDFDLIDAHYYYPDGVAAGIIARKLGRPFVVTARGSDVNLITQFARPRKLILDTAQRAYASIGVAQALTDKLAALGADSAKLRTFRNGVDLIRFAPMPQREAREVLGIAADADVFLSVGNLIPLKGHDLTITALREFPKAQLFIAGTGSEHDALLRHAAANGVADRVRLLGRIDNEQLRQWYSAADASILASSSEGWANVLLESMACGTPVVATRVGGSAEVVASAEAGRLVDERSATGIATALRSVLECCRDRAAIRRYAEGFSWNATTAAQIALFREMIDSAAREPRR